MSEIDEVARRRPSLFGALPGDNSTTSTYLRNISYIVEMTHLDNGLNRLQQ